MEPSSRLGGIVFYEDESAGYEAPNATEFAATFARYVAEIGMAPGDAFTLEQAFESKLDLRVDAFGRIGVCTRAEGPNAIAVAIGLSGPAEP